MVHVEMDEFDDELRNMQELMEEEEISLTDDSLKKPLTALRLRDAVTVESGTSLAKSIQKMIARKIGCLLVVQNQKLRGIFTERDALMKIAGQNVDLDEAVIDTFMTPDPVRLHMRDTVESALKLMVDRGYRHVSVVDENERPVAVVSIRDIVAYIVEFFPDDVLNLPPHPIRIGTKDREGG